MKRMLIAFSLCCALSGSALAGEMPGVDSSAVGGVPIVDSTSTGGTNTPPPFGVGSTKPLVTTMLLTIVTSLMGR